MDKTAKKRKRVQLTIENKLKVCEMANNNVPKAVIMSQFNISKSTLNDILRGEEKFKKFNAKKEESIKWFIESRFLEILYRNQLSQLKIF